MMVNYAVGSCLLRKGAGKPFEPFRKWILFFGVAFNVSLLCYFKYMNFFIENLNTLLGTDFNLASIILPLGVSFFTFAQITFVTDCYRMTIVQCNLLDYCTFSLFFPYVVSGPITRYGEIVPQLRASERRPVDWKNVSQGLYLLAIGLFKKIVLADSLAVWVANGFDKAAHLNFFEAWASSLCYTMQLYYDFSGYSDMAIGSALMLGISLPINFNSPYKSMNIQEFWRRWHISLSRFLRDYIYIPLGGSRRGEIGTYGNIFVTFLLAGLWHGSGWNFVIWGSLHACGLMVQRAWNKIGVVRLPRIVAWLITFNFINVCWVFFRAQTIGSAVRILRSMFFVNSIPLPAFLVQKFGFLHRTFIIAVKNPFKAIDGSYEMALILALSFPLILFFKNAHEAALDLRPTRVAICFIAVVILFSALEMGRLTQFLYVQF
jgi:D-alanyl-lipoteichoic acid acyltransferase DltB (MBOAT superfamily)